nr:hypothetical protein [Marinicella sp. W31]MDC2876580.1 hypothetical protein [Marinicella sp. W31]
MSDRVAVTLRDISGEPVFPLNDQLALSAFDEMAAGVDKHDLPQFLADRDDPLTAFLAASFSLSPFLFDSFRAHPELLLRIEEPFIPQLEGEIETARVAWRDADGKISDNDIMVRLRVSRRRIAFLTALADLAGIIAPKRRPRC